MGRPPALTLASRCSGGEVTGSCVLLVRLFTALVREAGVYGRSRKRGAVARATLI